MENVNIFENIAVVEIKTQSDYLAGKIKNMIVDKQIEGGYQFPNENEFCKMLNVGRGTLREAYKILDTQGYIKRTKQGTFVRAKEDVAKQGNFLASLELANDDELVEFVLALEPDAAFLAARRMNEDDLREIERLERECVRWQRDKVKLSEANYNFHDYIRNASKNQLIISALTAYYDVFDQQIIQPVYENNETKIDFIDQALEHHQQLIDAFRARDDERARKVMFDHLKADVEYQRK